MDPRAAFERIIETLAIYDRDGAVEALEDLCAWLRKGGSAR